MTKKVIVLYVFAAACSLMIGIMPNPAALAVADKTLSAGVETEASQALKKLAAAETETNRMLIEYSAQLIYAPAPPKGKEPRKVLTTSKEVSLHFLNGEREVRSNRSIRNGSQYNNQVMQFFQTKGKPIHQSSWSFDGRTSYSGDIDYDTPLYHTQISSGERREGPGGGALMGTLLSQGQFRLVDKPMLNGLQTLHIESVTKETNDSLAQTYNVWIAPERSYQVVREDLDLFFKSTEYALRRSRKEVLNFVQFRKVWLPQKWVSCDWVINRQGNAFYNWLDLNEVVQFKTLPNLQTSVFALDFPVGTAVSEPDRNASFIEGVDNSRYIALRKSATLPQELQDFLTHVVTEETAKNTATQKQQVAKSLK